jgi:4-hydroxybenzoate polyprenyltransferase
MCVQPRLALFLMSSPLPLPDSVSSAWWMRFMPHWLTPFALLARWDRPVGIWLLLIPCWWGQALVQAGQIGEINLFHSLLFVAGSIAMRGAGCTWNDILDRDIDVQVERTKDRPLACGLVSVRAAFLFLLIQCLVGLLVLIPFERHVQLTAVGSIVLVVLYPLAKRFLGVPQLVLGLVFSWGALVGFLATSACGTSLWPMAALYLATASWIVGFDSLYALQDVEDDIMVGIGSAAVTFGSRTVFFIAICYDLALIGLAAAFYLAGVSLLAWVGLVFFGLHLGWQMYTLLKRGDQTALMLFRSNRDAGLILLLALLLAGVTH